MNRIFNLVIYSTYLKCYETEPYWNLQRVRKSQFLFLRNLNRYVSIK